MQDKKPALSRRSLFAGAATVGAVAAATSVLPTVAQNVAARASSARYVMKMDAHCAIEPGFDRKMIAAMQAADSEGGDLD